MNRETVIIICVSAFSTTLAYLRGRALKSITT